MSLSFKRLNWNNQKQNLVDDDKHNTPPQAACIKLAQPEPQHNLSRNVKSIATVTCIVKSERVNLVTCDSNVYVIMSVAWYTYRHIKAELIVNYNQGFLISLYAHLMSHTLYMNQPFTFLSSLTLIISGGRYNL